MNERAGPGLFAASSREHIQRCPQPRHYSLDVEGIRDPARVLRREAALLDLVVLGPGGGIEMHWLVRHGESEANAGGMTSDDAGIGLTPRGRAQADAIAASCSERPAWVGLSPYLRARQTAEPLLARYPGIPVEELPVQEFTYLAAASCVGMTGSMRQPLRDAYWSRMDPEYVDGDGAESFAMLWRRGARFLRWAEDREGLGVVFSHAQFIQAVMIEAMYGLGEPTEQDMRRFLAVQGGLPVPNGAIVRLHREGGRWWVGGVDRTLLSSTWPTTR